MEITSRPLPAISMPISLPPKADRNSGNMTIAEYLRLIVRRAHGYTDDAGVKHPKIPQLIHFINGHDLVGVLRGSPHWVRNPRFYDRNSHV